ncbi:MAG: zf-HC2 domain-containing protein [Candidatus Omnitrophica bacterium]|nr:zf-HC2 domain-containing protein [Candidatus Omnitrophota bacterium]
MRTINRCPDELRLLAYLDGDLGDGPRVEIEKHLAGCPECLENLVIAKETDMPTKKGLWNGLIEFAKKNRWLLASGLSFGLSFALPRYFLQFLTATVILSLKWIFDSRATKTLIMIHNAWKERDNKGLHRIMDRIDIKK